ncbi:MAG: outer membrane beta-barrel protein [Ekhidna sp.]
MKRITIYTLTVACLLSQLQGQNDTTKIELTGYIDTYYAAYSNKLGPNDLQPYLTVAPRNNQFGLNIAEIGATYNTGTVRGTFTIQYGDIAEATWSARFKTIQEAWVGLEVLDGLWLDGGFFTTHIGAESFLPKNNFLSSTDIGTFNEPFYQSGARLSYEKAEHFSAQFHLVSGYNYFLDNNDAKSVGLLLNYTFNDQISISYTNLYGRESDEGATRQRRFYQNMYANWDPNKKISVIVGGDLSTQTNSELNDPSGTALMYNAFGIMRYRFTDQISTTGRLEVFNDKDGFISGTLINMNGQEQGLKASAATIGVEYAPSPQSYLRAETRWTFAEDVLDIFNRDNDLTNSRTEFIINMGFYFNKRLN